MVCLKHSSSIVDFVCCAMAFLVNIVLMKIIIFFQIRKMDAEK